MSDLKGIASQVRRDIVRMVHGVQSGHPGGSLGCTDYLTALYFDVMKHDPAFNMNGTGEDLFFLSNGHISPVFYSVLARSGYFPVEELGYFSQIEQQVAGPPSHPRAFARRKSRKRVSRPGNECGPGCSSG